MRAKKGDWVEIENIVLNPEERSAHLPEDTKKTPLKMWVKGFLMDEASLGEAVKVKTLANRTVEGKLVEINPKHKYDYGDTTSELLYIAQELQQQLREILKEVQ